MSLGNGLGMSGTGAGLFNRLFDAGLEIGTTYGKQVLTGVPAPGSIQAQRLGFGHQQFNQNADLGLGFDPYDLRVGRSSGGTMNQQTMLILAAVVLGAFLLAR